MQLPKELEDPLQVLTDWALENQNHPQGSVVIDALEDLVESLRGVDEGLRHQVRTAFSAAELHRIDGVRGTSRRSSWVRGVIEEVVLGQRLVGTGGSPAPADEEKLHRMTFWMRDDLLSRMDQLRGALTRSGWVRDTVLRILG